MQYLRAVSRLRTAQLLYFYSFFSVVVFSLFFLQKAPNRLTLARPGSPRSRYKSEYMILLSGHLDLEAGRESVAWTERVPLSVCVCACVRE